MKQLTFGGQNAEAYFSADGRNIIFQSTRPPFECDQIFSMNVDGGATKRLTTAKGYDGGPFFSAMHLSFKSFKKFQSFQSF